MPVSSSGTSARVPAGRSRREFGKGQPSLSSRAEGSVCFNTRWSSLSRLARTGPGCRTSTRALQPAGAGVAAQVPIALPLSPRSRPPPTRKSAYISGPALRWSVNGQVAVRAEFDDCEVSVGPGTTTMHAEMLDQGALQGVLQRIAGLGLELIEVRVAAPPPSGGDPGGSGGLPC